MKKLTLVVAVLFGLATVGEVAAQSRGSSGGSRGSSSSSSSSKPSSGSSGGSKSSSSGTSSSASKFGSGSSSKPSSGSSGGNKSSVLGSGSTSQKPGGSTGGSSSSKFSSGSSDSKSAETGKSKFGSPNSPPGSGSKSNINSQKPTGSSSSGIAQSEKARAAKQEVSRKEYVAQQKASAPPKEKYVASNGKEVKVDTQSKVTEKIRSRPSTEYTPERRTVRVTEHVTHHHYHHPYSWYGSQPYVYVGNGYSSAFFWIMMSEWDSQRRADWLYHNRDRIERSAYDQGVRDAQVQARLNELERQRIPRNRDYIDRDFANNPDLMFEDGYVEATYNPTIRVTAPPAVASSDGSSVGTVLLWIVLIGAVAAVGCWVVFTLRLGK
jgi:hypothetical protein